MSIKRVAINISLPDEDFKKKVIEEASRSGKSPSEEFVALYARKFRKAQ